MFEDTFTRISWEKAGERIYSSTEKDLEKTLARETLHADDIYSLFSPAADSRLEDLARKSYRITRMRFGNTIQLYTPLYISNYCSNTCLYCGFSRKNTIRRTTLTQKQVLDEAELIYNAGFRHILLLTGEDKKAVPLNYLEDIAAAIHRKFSSVSIEVYPMEKEEYGRLINAGVDGLTLYQETYNGNVYQDVHRAGKKRDFSWRLGGPDRGGMAGFRKIGIGALLGLADWRVEGFFTAIHALYLSSTYWKSHIQVSFPRLREAAGGYSPAVAVSDRDLTHLLCSMRIILPDAGLVLSTREPAELRDNLMPLGVTMMSAGSRTEPGGYSGMAEADEQFHVEDSRTPEEIALLIRRKGLDPVWKDWDREYIS